METRMYGVCLSVVLMICMIGNLAQGQSAPKWKPKSQPANGDSIIAKTDGSQVKLNCAVKGKPKPSIAWYKDGKLFDHTKRKKEDHYVSSVSTKLQRYSLRLNDVTVADKGNYMCVVRNTEGELNFTFLVDVIQTFWPLILEEPKNQTVVEGGKVEFHCRALNDPDATTKWLKRADQFLATTDSQGTLLLENVSLSDAGFYTCLVGNYVGIKSVEAYLTIIPKPTATTTSTTTTSTTTTPPTTTTTPITTTTTPTTTTTTRTVAKTTTLIPLPDLPGILPPRKTTTQDNQYIHGHNNRVPKKSNVTLTHISRIPHQVEVGEGVGENKKPVQGKQEEDMSVSMWTIYIIVGSVAGGVLLVGLVAIVVALCCNRIEENNGYKHTSVYQSTSGVPDHHEAKESHGNLGNKPDRIHGYSAAYYHNNSPQYYHSDSDYYTSQSGRDKDGGVGYHLSNNYVSQNY